MKIIPRKITFICLEVIEAMITKSASYSFQGLEETGYYSIALSRHVLTMLIYKLERVCKAKKSTY